MLSNSSTSIIISTFNQPEWLKKVLFGYEHQTFTDFEIIIADDGSTNETTSIIEFFKQNSLLNIRHVWHKDNGFQKTKILNKAIMASHGDYLIFSDGDCIPREDFVATHMTMKRANCFLSGGYFKLPLEISQLITKEDISLQNCFDKEWLVKNGMKPSFKMNKLTSKGLRETILNKFTPTKATWDGMNASAYKKDIIDINGFDERMQYGGEDREMGERLMNRGIKPIQIRYSAVCVHLEHNRSYANKKHETLNLAIRKETKKNKKTWTDFGIAQ